MIKILYSSSCMLISSEKSMLLKNGLSEEVCGHIRVVFPYPWINMGEGFKYLRYFLKPNDYRKGEWMLFFKKLEKIL